MKSLTSKTLPYRKCEKVYQKLLAGEIKEICRSNLRSIICQYCAATPKLVAEYEKRFVEFGFLKNDLRKTNNFLVNHKKFFSPVIEHENQNTSFNVSKEHENSKNNDVNRIDSVFTKSEIEQIDKQSKTVVYPVEGEKKVTCSFKGYNSLWQPFKKAVWADGFPDICYVLHIMISAYLSANREKIGRIDTSFPIGNMNFHITINAPYIVQRPRRKIA